MSDQNSTIQATSGDSDSPPSLTTALSGRIAGAIADSGGWIGFDAFMNLALYEPRLGYYANESVKFGLSAESGSDFVTAPEMSPLFGKTLATQIHEALAKTGSRDIYEFGAGSGALASQILNAVPSAAYDSYNIVDLSGTLRARQQLVLGDHAGRVNWLDELPASFSGVVIGNEVLDAMPVKLIVRKSGVWHERGVVLSNDEFAWSDKPTDLRPPVDIEGPHDYLTEIHPQAEAFVSTLAERMTTGAMIFIDYGFGESEYFHAQRSMGTVMCHRAHKSDADPLVNVGLKDITAHVNFTGIAVAGQEAGMEIYGYTTQARFLLNCGLLDSLSATETVAQLKEKAAVHRLIAEHEMGELFKVIMMTKGVSDDGNWVPRGFAEGDRTHRL